MRGAGAKRAPCAGDDDGADAVIFVGGVKRLDQFTLHRGVEGVQLLGPAQGDGENLLGDLVLNGFVGHGSHLPDLSFRDAPQGADPESISPTLLRRDGFSDVQLHIKVHSFHSRPGMTE
jgi:hypothetical protein